MKDWNVIAASILKAELKRRNLNYHDLLELLIKIGVEDTYRGLSSKINRGTFQFAFFLQCAEVLGIKNLSLT